MLPPIVINLNLVGELQFQEVLSLKLVSVNEMTSHQQNNGVGQYTEWVGIQFKLNCIYDRTSTVGLLLLTEFYVYWINRNCPNLCCEVSSHMYCTIRFVCQLQQI
jgi:hypothetical protein